jgi:hypothetical protein
MQASGREWANCLMGGQGVMNEARTFVRSPMLDACTGLIHDAPRLPPRLPHTQKIVHSHLFPYHLRQNLRNAGLHSRGDEPEDDPVESDGVEQGDWNGEHPYPLHVENQWEVG